VPFLKFKLSMEDWELDFKWLEARHKVKDLLGLDAVPDFQSVLFLIGIQELGQVKEDYTKEEKRDLIHIATCRLLSYEGYYEFEGIDAEGWPHWKLLAPFPKAELKEQERYLQVQVIRYLGEI
jgi:hypothetical protein